MMDTVTMMIARPLWAVVTLIPLTTATLLMRALMMVLSMWVGGVQALPLLAGPTRGDPIHPLEAMAAQDQTGLDPQSLIARCSKCKKMMYHPVRHTRITPMMFLLARLLQLIRGG